MLNEEPHNLYSSHNLVRQCNQGLDMYLKWEKKGIHLELWWETNSHMED